jgi:type I restriction enzyme S subunit
LNSVASGALLGFDVSTWHATTTGEVAEVRGGIQKQPMRAPVKNTKPFLRVANVGRRSLDLSDVHSVEVFDGEVATYALRVGDLLVVEGNGSVDQIGRAASWDGSIVECVHQNHLIRVRPNASLDPRFLELVWNAPLTIEHLKSVASSTSGLHTLSTEKVKRVALRLPDLGTQVALVLEAQRRLSLLDAAERTIKANLRKAEHLRQSLLFAAFSGKLVPQDPFERPASETLSELRAQRAAQEAAIKAAKDAKKKAAPKSRTRRKKEQPA